MTAIRTPNVAVSSRAKSRDPHPSRRLASVAASLVVLFAVPARNVAAQADASTHRAPRAESSDPVERQVRKLQRELDSLSSVASESDELTVAERRRVGERIGRAVERLNELMMRFAAEQGERGGRMSEVRVRIAPPMPERAAMAMSRAMTEVQEAQFAMPRGWLGFVAEGPGLDPRIEAGQLIIRFFSYPRIVSVDPSSPAQRAGLIPSDTLLAYNGQDVRDNDISMTRLLRPNARVSVRIRRDGRVREIPMLVAEAPSRISLRRDDEVRSSHEPWMLGGVPGAPAFPRSTTPVMAPLPPSARPPRPAQGAVGALAPVPPTPPAFGLRFSNTGVAGAELTTITEGLARVVGVGRGVLVTSVSDGTPASESGLQDGDVIVKAAGEAVRSVFEVRRLLSLAFDNGDRSLELEIIRQKKGRRVVLRW